MSGHAGDLLGLLRRVAEHSVADTLELLRVGLEPLGRLEALGDDRDQLGKGLRQTIETELIPQSQELLDLGLQLRRIAAIDLEGWTLPRSSALPNPVR